MIRIMIVDDHPLIREGLRTLLINEPDMEVVGEAGDGAEAVKLAKRISVDVILMDLVMPRLDGIQAIKKIMEIKDQVRILALSSFSDDEKVFPALKAGARGYMIKDSSPAELLSAIREIHNGKPSLHPAIAEKVLDMMNQESNHQLTQQPLTAREEQVLILVAKGLSNKKISTQLHIADRTVGTHISNILGKLHLANRTQAALYALREGLVNLYDD